MSDMILRQINMLSMIPVLPRKISVRDLHGRLAGAGQEVTLRTVERDLHKLSQLFGLTCDEGRPAGWSWVSGQVQVSLPQMDIVSALTHELVARYLIPVLPAQLVSHLSAEFDHARAVLDRMGSSPLGKWSRRIAVLPSGHQLLPAPVDEDTTRTVYESLLAGHRFEASYHAIDSDGPRRYPFNPLGLVYRDGVLYLVATVRDYQDPRQFALQRMSAANALPEQPAEAPLGFDFERYVREDKAFDYPVGEDIKLELIVDDRLARHLGESRLANDQTINPFGDGRHVVRAKVMHTSQLVWWLYSLGAAVEVCEPAPLRNKMAQRAREMAALYAKHPGQA